MIDWQGENRLAHSMCKSMISIEEILTVLNSADIDNTVKKSYVFYMTVVYVTSPFNTTEIGIADLSHSRSVDDDDDDDDDDNDVQCVLIRRKL